MKQHVLGQGLTVSALGMGCLTLTEPNYGPIDESQSERTLHRAIDLGISFLDTGETYGPDGRNESLVGRVIKQRRAEVIVGTKFGLRFDLASGSMIVDSDPQKIRAACEGSLRRLQTDYIDVYYLHRVDPAIPIEDVWGVLAELVAEGKIRHTGMSEPGLTTLRRAHAVHPVAVVENEYSLFTRDPEDAALPVLRELGIGLACFAPLGRGFLSGTIRTPDDFAPDDFRRRLPRYQGDNFRKNLELVDTIHAMADDRGLTAAQLGLAWLISRGHDVVPIPGLETIERLEENVKAAEVTLSDEELATIESIIPDGAVGHRAGIYDSLNNADSI